MNDTKGPIIREDLALNAPQKILIAGGAIAVLLLLIYLLDTQHISQSLLLGIGFAARLYPFHARFGFTSAFRRIMSVGNGQAMRSHMLMLAVAVTLFAPILAYGSTFWRFGCRLRSAGGCQPNSRIFPIWNRNAAWWRLCFWYSLCIRRWTFCHVCNFYLLYNRRDHWCLPFAVLDRRDACFDPIHLPRPLILVTAVLG